MPRSPDNEEVAGDGNVADGGFCEGDACDMVAVGWDERQGAYLVSNRADRQVRVRFSTRFSTTELLLPARGEALLYTDSFEHPVRATYAREEPIMEKGD